jgi:hypothetical protein
MKKKKRPGLSAKQKLFLADFAGGRCAVSVLLEQHQIRPGDYQRWLGNPLFADEMNARIALWRQDSHILLEQSAATAAAKLMKLAESEGETGRKACLDILTLLGQDGQDKTIAAPTVEMSDGLAEKILEVMAGGIGD